MKLNLIILLRIISILKATGKFLIYMNQTNLGTFAPSRKWQPSKSLMPHKSFILTELATVISNGTLLWKLFKRRCKIRADKMFIILS